MADRIPLALRDTGAARARTDRRPEEVAADVPPRRRLLCAQCRTPVTDANARVHRLGRHEHVFANPDGVVFRIGCFADAPGCRMVGAATGRWTWFPGFRWQVALCAACGAHLGWRYSGPGAERFYGLILARLVERSEGG